jgi:hypothetical protein
MVDVAMKLNVKMRLKKFHSLRAIGVNAIQQN